MTSMTRTNAPADLLGLGGSDVRPYAGGAVLPSAKSPVVVAQGAGLPIGGPARRVRGTVDALGAFQPATRRLQVVEHNYIAPNDGTTLGIHSSRRPLS